MGKILVAAMAVGVAFVSLATTSEASEPNELSLVTVTCSGGALVAHGAHAGDLQWHVNDKAPWKWDKGEKVSLSETENVAKFKGAKCEGTIKAYVCSGNQCKGPIAVPVH